MKIFLAAIILWSTQFVLAFANDHGVMQWTYYQYNDDANRGRMTSQLFIGVPETDDSLGFATCFAGSTAGLPSLQLFAEVDGFASGQEVAIDFFADAGPMRYRGFANANGSGEMFPTVTIGLDMNDPLWQVFQRMGQITYSVNGRSVVLPLRGSGRSISSFLADCRIYHGNFNPNAAGNPQPVQPTVPTNTRPAAPFDPRWASCDTLGGTVSQNSDTPVQVTFRNQTGAFRSVMWIGFDGTPKTYASLNPGEEFTINTFLTHPWMFTDGPGNCLEMFMPQLGVPVFNISAPNRDFGPE